MVWISKTSISRGKLYFITIIIKNTSSPSPLSSKSSPSSSTTSLSSSSSTSSLSSSSSSSLSSSSSSTSSRNLPIRWESRVIIDFYKRSYGIFQPQHFVLRKKNYCHFFYLLILCWYCCRPWPWSSSSSSSSSSRRSRRGCSPYTIRSSMSITYIITTISIVIVITISTTTRDILNAIKSINLFVFY